MMIGSMSMNVFSIVICVIQWYLLNTGIGKVVGSYLIPSIVAENSFLRYTRHLFHLASCVVIILSLSLKGSYKCKKCCFAVFYELFVCTQIIKRIFKYT